MKAILTCVFQNLILRIVVTNCNNIPKQLELVYRKGNFVFDSTDNAFFLIDSG